MDISGLIKTKHKIYFINKGENIMDKILAITNRIELLKTRKANNANIIRKLERQLRRLEEGVRA